MEIAVYDLGHKSHYLLSIIMQVNIWPSREIPNLIATRFTNIETSFISFVSLLWTRQLKGIENRICFPLTDKERRVWKGRREFTNDQFIPQRLENLYTDCATYFDTIGFNQSEAFPAARDHSHSQTEWCKAGFKPFLYKLIYSFHSDLGKLRKHSNH